MIPGITSFLLLVISIFWTQIKRLCSQSQQLACTRFISVVCASDSLIRPNKPLDHLILDIAPNLGPLLSRWEINRFENC